MDGGFNSTSTRRFSDKQFNKCFVRFECWVEILRNKVFSVTLKFKGKSKFLIKLMGDTNHLKFVTEGCNPLW